MKELPTTPVPLDALRHASERLAPYIVRTPLLRSPRLDAVMGGLAFLKAENTQLTGSFKFRGALSHLLAHTPAERAKGVVAFSSGNHAQGVALAAKVLDLPATIVMPDDAPAVKRQRTEALGAQIVPYSRLTEDREAIAQDLAQKTGALLVPPFEHEWVIAGQGTAGLEIVEDLRRYGHVPDILYCCCSGGGLSAGIGLAVKGAFPDCRIVTVEPEGYDDMKKSLETGARVHIHPQAPSICDALLVPTPGVLPFRVLRDLGAVGVTVSDREVRAAMRFAADELGQILEPGGAVALAALLSGGAERRGRRAVAILSGGNIDPALRHDILG
ncbi:putative threonine dehydratase [Parvularcula bermudensis HTCC2503]|uniref:Putative threonine dehydratase n=1 Tax=Parvularcula bermudensis (strain ATCC BAA-594 / HTCC2503 / KCTC 12087) TaxID=314260 RepID=E0TFB3_PARBH|nr:threonine/serine dehydratase [Parvularcula bermudensis]ADM09031.1 putative threonine dehydratase [Parvularcula bermudensis HTCC2503]